MKLEIERFLERIDEWKFKLHEKLKGLSPAQRKAFWNRAHERARARGLNVVDADKPAKPDRLRQELVPNDSGDPLLNLRCHSCRQNFCCTHSSQC